MEALLEDMRKLAQRIVETNAKLERLCVATSLNSAAIQLIGMLGTHNNSDYWPVKSVSGDWSCARSDLSSRSS